MSQPKAFLDTLIGTKVNVILSDSGRFLGTFLEWNSIGFVVEMDLVGKRFIPWTAIFSVDNYV